MNTEAMSVDSQTSAQAALPHVLVVDDDAMIRDLVSDYLWKNEMRVSAGAEVHQGKPEGIRAYRFDRWELNLNSRRLVSPAGKPVPLSNGEFSLLVVLLGAPNRILSRDQLLDLSRLHNDEVYNRSVDVQILRIRRKIEKDAAQPRYIRTERGAGYIFGVPVVVVY